MSPATPSGAAGAGVPAAFPRRALSRLLSWLEEDDADTLPAKLAAFQVVLLLLLVTEYWCRALVRWQEIGPIYQLNLGAVTLLGLAGLWRPARRVAFLGIAVAQAIVVQQEFPATGNHAYLELVLCALSALLDLDVEADRRLYLRAVRWMVVVVFFFSGFQKLVHGYYFRGQYLAYSAWIESFRPVLRWLLPAGDLERFVSYGRATGAGPFLVRSPWFLMVSNGVYLAEMGAAVMLVVPRTRGLGLAIALFTIVGIELAAREVFFGLVFVNGLGTFLPRAWNRWLLPPAIAFLLVLLLVRAGVLPDATFY